MPNPIMTNLTYCPAHFVHVTIGGICPRGHFCPKGSDMYKGMLYFLKLINNSCSKYEENHRRDHVQIGGKNYINQASFPLIFSQNTGSFKKYVHVEEDLLRFQNT